MKVNSVPSFILNTAFASRNYQKDVTLTGMNEIATTQIDILARMENAVQKVRDRLLRSSRALEQAGIPYAVVGGNAVAALVSEVDEAAVRNTQDVDILLRREDLERAKVALEACGFVYRHAASIDMFLDGPNAKARDAVHIIFANEKVRQEYDFPCPDVTDSKTTGAIRVVSLEALVRMKLISHRLKDMVHIQDFISVGLVDASWVARLPKTLGDRLQSILDNPEG